MQPAILEQVYRFIEGYIRDEGMSPSMREIAKGCHLNLDKTLDAVSILEARGKIERIEGQQRSIKILTSPGD